MINIEHFLLTKFKKITLNRMPVRNPSCEYQHPDLQNISRKAAERGEKFFYYEPVDINKPYSKIRECNPRNVYVCTGSLKEKEYEQLIHSIHIQKEITGIILKRCKCLKEKIETAIDNEEKLSYKIRWNELNMLLDEIGYQPEDNLSLEELIQEIKE